MITTRSPLRITLGGGGTDLASYYQDYGGFLISAAIDKYIYINVMRPFKSGIYLKYSDIEAVHNVLDVRHPIIRESLNLFNFNNPQIEITSLADIPAGTGLGSSGSFTTALLLALYAFERKQISRNELADLACHIEIDILKEPIGKQDQYISAYGGITTFLFNRDGSVTVEPLNLSRDTIYDLEDNLHLFFTGFTRKAADILSFQNTQSINKSSEMIDGLHYTKELGLQSKDALVSGDTIKFGQLMHEHWLHKKRRSPNMSNSQIDDLYALGLRNGAIGGKVVGAGGGGFLMFYSQDRLKLKRAMSNVGLEEVRFRFDHEGAKLI